MKKKKKRTAYDAESSRAMSCSNGPRELTPESLGRFNVGEQQLQ